MTRPDVAGVRFRKKPVVIEAVQFDGWDVEAVEEFVGQSLGLSRAGGQSWTITIPTLEGAMTAQAGDWIIKGIKGEFYPCKPDIFAATYEPAALAPGDAGEVERVARALFEYRRKKCLDAVPDEATWHWFVGDARAAIAALAARREGG